LSEPHGCAYTNRPGSDKQSPPHKATGCASLIILVLLALLPSLHAWQETLTPDTPGPFAEVPPFQAEFRIGWSEIEAASAHAAISYDSDAVVLKAGGGSTGLARMLYQLDASFNGRTDRKSLHTLNSEQLENYTSRKLSTLIEGSAGRLRTLREWQPPGEKPAKWKEVKIAPVRDFFAGMLFIRSQLLSEGECVRLTMFPGGAPFFVEIESRGVERIDLAESPRDAIRLDLKIQRVNTKKSNSLEPHSKFRSGKIWLSNDADRIPLRAEVDIFIGYVFAEITNLQKLPIPPPNKESR
jgi:hypothetical protein